MHPLNEEHYDRLTQFVDMSRYQRADVNPFFLCPRDFTWTGWSCPGAEDGHDRLEVKCSFTEIEPPQEGQTEYKYHPMRYLLHFDGTINREEFLKGKDHLVKIFGDNLVRLMAYEMMTRRFAEDLTRRMCYGDHSLPSVFTLHTFVQHASIEEAGTDNSTGPENQLIS